MVKLFSGACDVDALELGGVCEHRDWCLPPTGEYKRQRCKWEEKKKQPKKPAFGMARSHSHGFIEHWKSARLEPS